MREIVPHWLGEAAPCQELLENAPPRFPEESYRLWRASGASDQEALELLGYRRWEGRLMPSVAPGTEDPLGRPVPEDEPSP